MLTAPCWQNADLVVGSQLSNVLSQQGSWHRRCLQRGQLTGNNCFDPRMRAKVDVDDGGKPQVLVEANSSFKT